MNIWYLYFFLAALSFPFTLVVASWISRQIWSQKLSLIRQLSLSIIGFPILFSFIHSSTLFTQQLVNIVLMWITWALYLILAFQATHHTIVGMSRSFVTISRTIIAFFLWILIFQENIEIIDIIGILMIFWCILRIWKSKNDILTKEDFIGILFSLAAWSMHVTNAYFFKIVSHDFTALQSAYILEFSSFIPLAAMYFFFPQNKKNISKKTELQAFKTMTILAPIIFLWSYGLAQSIQLIPFYVYNTLLVLGFIMSIIFGKIILGEHISTSRLFSIFGIITWCFLVVI